MATHEARTRRWARIESGKLVDLGSFRLGEAVEFNLADRVLEVCCESATDLSSSFGWRHARCEVFRPPAAVRSLAMPSAAIRAGDLLP